MKTPPSHTTKSLTEIMKRLNAIISIFTLTTFYSCNNDIKFSEEKNLSEFKNTQFVPTLEHKISNDKNSIYCATFLFAWDEVKKQLNSPLTISDDFTDLKLLNQSMSFENVLKNNEYKAIGKVSGDFITASAEFNKSLPFEVKLQNFENKLTFEGQKVSSFGVTGDCSLEQKNIVQIVYYKNDNNFIIKLLPKEKEHEIILFATEQSFNSIADMTEEINKKTEIGKVEKQNDNINWKYYYNETDEVIIPKFNFNIETNYKTLEGNIFKSNKGDFTFKVAYQRTAFFLDESGAEIESEVEVVHFYADSVEKPKPKKMIFDKPFLVILKRTNIKNPYFGLWITNSELMIRE